jgi:hypothetical protein
VQFCDSRPCGGLQGAPHNSHIQTSKSVRVKSSMHLFKSGPLLFTALQSASFGVFFSQSKTHTKQWARWQRTHAVALCVIDAGKDVERDHVQLSISRGQTLCELCASVNGRKCSTRVFLCRTHAHASNYTGCIWWDAPALCSRKTLWKTHSKFVCGRVPVRRQGRTALICRDKRQQELPQIFIFYGWLLSAYFLCNNIVFNFSSRRQIC